MNIVMIIPTGIGAVIGGHAGDANPVAKLLASTCDNLITHPNVVNASDINEMTDNTLYVEGSILNRFLRGEIKLEKVKQNRILVVANKPASIDIINSVSAARVTIGIDSSVLVLNTPLRLIAEWGKDGKATGTVLGWKELIDQVKCFKFDALAISTKIEIDKEVALKYLRGSGGVNPWGGVEAKASKLIATALGKQVAHAPQGSELEKFIEVVDPRMSAECVSISYLHCILKGLHKAPRISTDKGLHVNSVDCLITPINCVGEPHYACLKAGIPVIAVKENTTCLNDIMPKEFIVVENYLEAAGLVMTMKAGVSRESVRRPIAPTKVV